MRITIEKELIPQLNTRISGIKGMEQYQFSGYSQSDSIMTAPSDDLTVDLAIDIARIGATLEAFEYWMEIPNTDLNNDVTSGLSYETYFDENEVEQTRTWADLDEFGENQDQTATMRYWQNANNGEFIYNDVELIREDGYEVFGKAELDKKMNTDYEDDTDPEYTVIETIEYIDQRWRFGGYFDIVHAQINMREIYLAKGIDENDAWNNCTDAEKEVLVRWNQVGLNKSASIGDPSWSEGRTFKELGRKYREHNFNVLVGLDKRFTDWYQYLNMMLSASGKSKFETDFDFDLKEEYIHRMKRQYELGETNALVEWNQTVLSTYTDGDFVGTISATTIVNALEGVLTEKSYFV